MPIGDTNGAVRGAADPRRRPQVAHHRGLPARPRRHPDSPDPADLAAVRRYLDERSGRPTAVDLFCGAGGLSLGLERAGFDVLVGADSDDWAVRTHDANLPGLSWCGDLTDPTEFLSSMEVWGIEHVDLVAGGVPCQPFSRAGRPRIRDLVATGSRAAHDVRADLWSSFVQVVEKLSPSAVVVENVPDLPRWNDGAVLIGLYESLRDLGYRVEARILDSYRHGVPQHRQRLILIGLAEGRPPIWPEAQDSFVTLAEAIGDLPPIPRAQRHERLRYDSRRATSPFQRLMREGLDGEAALEVTEHICRDVRPDDMEAYRLLKEGQTYIDLPPHLQRYRSDVFTDKYKRLAWSELCRSITAHIAKDGYWYIHPDQHRTLSIREAARVQSFPDDFRFAGTQTHRYRQIGNAVPVLLGEAVGRAVIEGLAQSPEVVEEARDDFRDTLTEWRRRSTLWSPSWRASADPWLVLCSELAAGRKRPAEAEALAAGLREHAPTPARLLQHRQPEEVLLRLGVAEPKANQIVTVARELEEWFEGEVPSDDLDLRMLPGIGESVASAVLTFGFGRRQVMVDRGTARVASRVVSHSDDRRFQRRLDLHRLAGTAGPDADFNRALLDLGREICVAVPKCGECPIRRRCSTGRQAEAQGPAPRQLEFEVA